MANRFGFKALTVVLLIAMLAGFAWAQGGSTGAISGTVLDEKGGVMPNAKVEVYNIETGEKVRQVTSSSAGTFNVPFLDPGKYRVEITSAGFEKFVTSLAVLVSETAAVSANMRVGAMTTVVIVEGTVTPVDTTSPTTGQTLTSESVNDLPLSTRNFLTLLTLDAGANTELFDNAALGRGQVTINVNGQRPTNNNYELEGINANDFNLPVLDHVPLPNPDTVEEFKTQTSLYDASTGRNGGGNTQVDLKSGTSTYHGGAYEFFRNEDFNANDWFLNNDGQPRPELRQNQFGASFGGPVPAVKNFFFFMNYQGTREISGAATGTVAETTLPVLPEVRTSASLTPIFFPSGLPASYTSTALDPTALAWLNLPASKCPGFNDGTNCIPTLAGTPGFTGSTINTASLARSLPGTFDDDQFVVTVDKVLTSADKISGRVFFSNNSILEPFGTGVTLPFALANPGSNRFIKVGWVRTIGANMVNNLHVGWSRYLFDQSPTEPITLADIGATRPNASTVPAAYELNVTGGGAFSIGTGINDVRGGTFNTYNVGDDFSITHGKHLFRFGGEYNKYQLNRFNHYGSRGVVTFGNTTAGEDFAGDPALTGFQNFLLGRVTTTAAQAGLDTFHFRDGDPAFYFQDDWKITAKLTLNLGLRWEGLSQSHETHDFMSNFQGNGDGSPIASPTLVFIHPAGTANIGTPGVSNCTYLHCMDKKDFAPRVGFAWDPIGDHKTVVRGGFGIYYDRISNQALLQSGGGFPFSETIAASPFSVTPQNPFAGLPPPSAFPLTGAAAAIPVPQLVAFNGTTGEPIFNSAPGCDSASTEAECTPLQQFFFFGRRNIHAPYSEVWNFGIQRELGAGWLAEVRYVGTHGVDLLGTGAPVNPGQICTAVSPCTIPAVVGSGVTVPAGTPYITQNSNGSISITGSTAANLDARVPAQYLGLQNSGLFAQTQYGNSIYHSLQARLSHQFSRGLYFQAAYTYSHAIDNSSGSTFSDELDGLFGFGNLLNQRDNRGTSDFDRTHRLVFSYNYLLPFARWAHKSDQGVVGRLVSGWSLNGVTTFQSGTPFVIVDSSALTLQDLDGFNGTNYATLAPGMTRADVINPGSVQSNIHNGNGFVNLNAFTLGGNCVDSQNVVLGPAVGGSCGGFPTAVGAAVGNVTRNLFRGPFQQNWDMSLIKTTRITERTSIDFRAEAFNVFNHPSFQSPQAYGGFFGNYGYVNIAGATSAVTGTVSSPRILQLALKFNF